MGWLVYLSILRYPGYQLKEKPSVPTNDVLLGVIRNGLKTRMLTNLYEMTIIPSVLKLYLSAQFISLETIRYDICSVSVSNEQIPSVLNPRILLKIIAYAPCFLYATW
jgi:hypothetical protein